MSDSAIVRCLQGFSRRRENPKKPIVGKLAYEYNPKNPGGSTTPPDPFAQMRGGKTAYNHIQEVGNGQDAEEEEEDGEARPAKRSRR